MWGNHVLVRAITHHPLKLGSPNLDLRCKRPWLRSLPIVLGGVWPWPSRSILTSKSKFTPFWACLHDNSSHVQAKFEPEVQNTLIKIPIVFGVDWARHVKFNWFSKYCLFASLLRLWNICEIDLWKRSLFHILNGCAHICWPTGSCHGPWNSGVVSLVWPLLASQSSTRQLAMECFCRLSPNYTYLTCQNFVCQHWVMAETTVKQHAFAFILFVFQNIGILSALFLVQYKHKAYDVTHHVPGFRQGITGGEVGTVAFKTVSTASFTSCNGV